MTLFSSGLGHDRGHASSSSCAGPRHGSHGACIGSSLKTSRDRCLFANGSSRSSNRVASLRHDSKSVSKLSHLNRYLHHAKPHDKLSAMYEIARYSSSVFQQLQLQHRCTK